MMATSGALAMRIAHLPQRTRRAAVLAAFLGYPIVFVGYSRLVATGIVPQVVWAPIAVILMAAFIAGTFVVYLYARNRADPRDETLDERQHALAVRAWALSYGVVTAFAVAVATIWALYVVFVGPVTVGADLLVPVTIGVSVYIPVLPSAVLAWIEPDSIDLDDAA